MLAMLGQVMKKLLLTMVAACCVIPTADAGGDDVANIRKVLTAALNADKTLAREAAQRAIELLDQKKIPAQEVDRLAGRTLEVLRHTIETPADVRAIFPQAKVIRQVLYRRYREQWTTTHPLAIRIVFDCRRGREPERVSVELVKQ